MSLKFRLSSFGLLLTTYPLLSKLAESPDRRTPQQLQAAAQRLFAAPECGQVLRVKGFAPAPAGGWLELNATAAGCTLAPIPQGQEVVIVIGEALDKAAIEAKLKG